MSIAVAGDEQTPYHEEAFRSLPKVSRKSAVRSNHPLMSLQRHVLEPLLWNGDSVRMQSGESHNTHQRLMIRWRLILGHLNKK